MEWLGVIFAAVGGLVGLGALAFWCRDNYVTERQEKIVSVIIRIGALLIAIGGCIELYFRFYVGN
jgi:hypothetical protein